ncbi:MAG: MFS transporter [Fimbriimonadaceae bacterium]
MLPLEPLRHKPFRTLFVAQCISQLGDAFYYVIFMFMVAKITGRNDTVGVIGALETIPFVVFSLYAGVLADRKDRRKLIVGADLASFSILTGFAAYLLFDAEPPFWLMCVTVLMLSISTAFLLPSRSAAVPQLVPRSMLLKANALLATARNIMPLFSLALSATVLAALYAISPQMFFLAAVSLNALSFLISAIIGARLPKLVPERTESVRHPVTDLREGVRYIRGRRELVTLLILSMALNLFIAPFFVVYVAVNNAWFGGLPQTLAWFEFLFFAGMIAGSLAVARSGIRRVGVGYAVGLGIVGACVALMAFSPTFWLFALWNIVCGLALPFAQIPLSTFIQATVPNHFQGRVQSALMIAGGSVMPIGQLLGGTMVQYVGLVASFLVMGIGMVVAGAVGLLDGPFRRASLPEGVHAMGHGLGADGDTPDEDPRPHSDRSSESVARET